MIKENRTSINRFQRLLDIVLTILAFIGAYFIKRDFLPSPFAGLTTAPNYYIVLLMVIIVWYVCFEMTGVYVSYRKVKISGIYWKLFRSVTTGFLVMVLSMYLFKINDVSRLMMGIFYLLNLGLLGLSRTVVYYTLRYYRSRGYNVKNVLIVGSRRGAVDVIDAIGERMDAGFRVAGCLETEAEAVGKKVKNGVRVIDTVDNLKQVLTGQVVDELIFSMPLQGIKNVEKHISLAEEIGISVRILPQWWLRKQRFSPKIGTLFIEDFLEIPTLTLSTMPREKGALITKNFIDYTAAALGFISMSPIILFIVIAIKLISPGPAVFSQERCGKNGRRFRVYKFRTMVADAETRRGELLEMNEADGPVFKMRNDPRIVPVIGPFLRRSGLDELPQLVNVLKGEMSLIGPRPPIPEEVEKYDVWQRRRLSMKPGMTCIWQTSHRRNEMDFNEWMEKDLEYIDNWSLFLDAKILLKTVRAVVRMEGV